MPARACDSRVYKKKLWPSFRVENHKLFLRLCNETTEPQFSAYYNVIGQYKLSIYCLRSSYQNDPYCNEFMLSSQYGSKDVMDCLETENQMTDSKKVADNSIAVFTLQNTQLFVLV